MFEEFEEIALHVDHVDREDGSFLQISTQWDLAIAKSQDGRKTLYRSSDQTAFYTVWLGWDNCSGQLSNYRLRMAVLSPERARREFDSAAEELVSRGEAFGVEHEGRTFVFVKNPDKYLADALEAEGLKGEWETTCNSATCSHASHETGFNRWAGEVSRELAGKIVQGKGSASSHGSATLKQG